MKSETKILARRKIIRRITADGCVNLGGARSGPCLEAGYCPPDLALVSTRSCLATFVSSPP
jgi:hypothetical protein